MIVKCLRLAVISLDVSETRMRKTECGRAKQRTRESESPVNRCHDDVAATTYGGGGGGGLGGDGGGTGEGDIGS